MATSSLASLLSGLVASHEQLGVGVGLPAEQPLVAIGMQGRSHCDLLDSRDLAGLGPGPCLKEKTAEAQQPPCSMVDLPKRVE